MESVFAYGCSIRSSFITYPETISAYEQRCVVQLRRGGRLTTSSFPYIFPSLHLQNRTLTYFADRDYQELPQANILFVVKDVVAFSWQPDNDIIMYDDTLPFFDTTLLQYWLLHTVIPLRLTLQNAYHFIHSGCVEWQSRAIVLTAPSHHGKSTMTHHFLQNGHTLISDDMTGFRQHDGTFQALPSYPYHRHYRKVEDLGTFTTRWTGGHRPVHAVFSLQPAAPHAPVEITRLRGMQAFEVLRGNSTIDMSFQRPQALRFLGEMAQSVPVYRLQVPWDLKRLPEVRTAVLERCEA